MRDGIHEAGQIERRQFLVEVHGPFVTTSGHG